jgi:membrane-associated phospholipid phosphatase
MTSTTESRSPARPTPEGFLARRPIIGLGLLLLGGLIFGLLAFNVRTNGPLLAWDVPIDQALHARATQDSRLGFEAMRFSGDLGQTIAVVFMVVLGLYWLWKRHWYEISMLLIGVTGGTIWFFLLSNLLGRHRPIFPDPLLAPLPGPGFPSGHSITSMLFYGLILYLLLTRLPSWRWRLLAAIDTTLIILLVGYSRLYMGDHYPTDVLGGYAFGLAWGALVYTSIEIYRQRRSARRSKATG